MKHRLLRDTYKASYCLSDAPSLNRCFTDGYENSRRFTDACGHIYKKKCILVIFGKFKKRNPRAVGFFRRILDRNECLEGRLA